MKIINRKVIPGTRNKYELHEIKYNDDAISYGVYSVKSEIYLKNTTSYKGTGSKGLMATYGLSFEDDKETTVQRKVYLKEILKLCEVNI
jgi:hypothetical protein